MQNVAYLFVIKDEVFVEVFVQVTGIAQALSCVTETTNVCNPSRVQMAIHVGDSYATKINRLARSDVEETMTARTTTNVSEIFVSPTRAAARKKEWKKKKRT
tara:strand:- start:2499 stop:2804 length:306 start_codon:yes stop_codon:yes gene_type:complete